MKSIFVVLLAVCLGLSAEAQKKKELTTLVNVNYCLPKVVYRVEVMLECEKYIPGPYRNYAEKELGIKPEIDRAREVWKVTAIDIEPQYIPDEKAVYSVSASGDYLPVMLSLTGEGFLAGVSAGKESVFNEELRMEFQSDRQPEQSRIDMMKLNTYNHLKEVLDTNYTFQEIDGVMKKIWDPIIRYVPKTESDNVKEAVSEIFRIRSERVKLLGAENNVPDGKSLELILKEFDRMEQNYLSLFMGGKETYRMKRVFECVPEKEEEPVVIFRFTEENGIADKKNVSALAYCLKITDVTVAASTPVNGETATSAIFYRVPAVGELQLLRGKEEVMSFRAVVPQLGEIKKFPVDIISNEGISIEFYPQFGSLKKINRK